MSVSKFKVQYINAVGGGAEEVVEAEGMEATAQAVIFVTDSKLVKAFMIDRLVFIESIPEESA